MTVLQFLGFAAAAPLLFNRLSAQSALRFYLSSLLPLLVFLSPFFFHGAYHNGGASDLSVLLVVSYRNLY